MDRLSGAERPQAPRQWRPGRHVGQPGDPVLIGRYVLPLVSLWALGIAAVAAALPRRWGLVFGAGVLTVGALLQVSGLGLTLTRFYG